MNLIVRTLVEMPLYEYRCNDCAAVFELLRPMADREIAAICPSCESRASMPLISRVAVHAGSSGGEAPSTSGGGGGGCCGGNCGCGN
jgi:putative FmdB family regulatory protein